MGLSYILLYRQYKDCQDCKLSRCPRDPDSPSLSTSVLSSLTFVEPRRERSSQDPRLSSDSGLTSRARSSRTPRTSSTSHPDAKMIPIFGKDKVRAFGMAKFLKT